MRHSPNLLIRQHLPFHLRHLNLEQIPGPGLEPFHPLHHQIIEPPLREPVITPTQHRPPSPLRRRLRRRRQRRRFRIAEVLRLGQRPARQLVVGRLRENTVLDAFVRRRLPSDGDAVAGGESIEHPHRFVVWQGRKRGGASVAGHPETDSPRVVGGAADGQDERRRVVDVRKFERFDVHDCGGHELVAGRIALGDVEVDWPGAGAGLDEHQDGSCNIDKFSGKQYILKLLSYQFRSIIFSIFSKP